MAVAVTDLGESLFDRHDLAVRAGRHVTVGQHTGKHPRRGLELPAQDVGEATDLMAKEPDKAKELQTVWDKWNAQLAKPLWGAGAKGSAQEDE